MFINQGLGKYRGRVMREAVTAHADSLVSGDECASRLLDQHPNEASALEELFQVSNSLHGVLVPVNPRTQFVYDLKAELQKSKAALLVKSQEQHLRSATIVSGAILSILAVTALITRLIGVVVVVVAFLARRHRSVAPA